MQSEEEELTSLIISNLMVLQKRYLKMANRNSESYKKYEIWQEFIGKVIFKDLMLFCPSCDVSRAAARFVLHNLEDELNSDDSTEKSVRSTIVNMTNRLNILQSRYPVD